MNNWYTENSSTDITYCTSKCDKKNCSRNTNGAIFKKIKDDIYGLYLYSDLSTDCSEYVPEEAENKL